MLKSLIGLSLIFSASSALAGLKPSPYQFDSIAHRDIDQVLVIGSDETNTPESLQGLWWMDGNPLPDEVISFASAQFEPKTDDNGNLFYEAAVAVYDSNIWSWHDTLAGRSLYRVVESQKLTYILRFNEDFTSASIIPRIKPVAVLGSLTIPQSMLITFDLNKLNEDEWSRDTVLFGQESSYRFRRIVDGDGNRLPAYDDYVKAIDERGPENALIPQCTTDLVLSLPSGCSFDI